MDAGLGGNPRLVIPRVDLKGLRVRPKRVEPVPQLSSNRLVFKVPVLTRGLPRT